MPENSSSRSALLGTPVGSRQDRSDKSPAPSASNAEQKSGSEGQGGKGSPFTASDRRSGSPFKLNRPTTFAQAHNTAPPSFAGSAFGDSTSRPVSDDLKGEMQRLQRRTRIVADPSLVSSFSREDDPELYALFRG